MSFIFQLKARPAAKRTRSARMVDIGDGKSAVEVSVAAAAVDGKANKAICEAVAEGLGVKTSAVSIKAGHTARIKIIEVDGDPAVLNTALKLWVQALI